MIEIVNITPEFSRPFQLDKLSTASNTLHIEATREECDALCERFSLLALDRLSADLVLTPVNGMQCVRLKGRISADVIQQCVVSLEPVPAHVDESFSLTYVAEQGNDRKKEKEIVVEFDDDEDFPEPIIGNAIDLGEAVAEHLMLALDPFPRSQKVIDEAQEADDEPKKKSSPFQSLVGVAKKKL